MKIIDLLNKIANGEEVPKKIRIDHWCYKFEWKDYAGNYVDEHEDIDLMSALSCDREELNYEVREIEEEKKIPEKIEENEIEVSMAIGEQICANKINEIIDYLIDELEDELINGKDKKEPKRLMSILESKGE